MITQFKVLLFLLCINVVSTVVLTQYDSEYLLPFLGPGYMSPLNSTGSTDEYLDNFNATDMVGGENGTGGWSPVGGLGFAGDIFSGLNMAWNLIRFLVDGLGMTLEWAGSFIPAASTGFTAIRYIVWIIGSAMFSTLVIEFITGRQLLP